MSRSHKPGEGVRHLMDIFKSLFWFSGGGRGPGGGRETREDQRGEGVLALREGDAKEETDSACF